MSSPVQLSDLPEIFSANNGDLLLLRSMGTDYKINVTAIRYLNLSLLSTLPSNNPIASDLLLITRNNLNYRITFGQIGFVPDTCVWFYNTTPPTPNWKLVTNTGDRLLGVSSGTRKYAGVDPGVIMPLSAWQQGDVGGVTGQGLSITQIPNHRHWGRWGSNQSNEAATYLYGAKDKPSGSDPKFGGGRLKGPVLGIVNGQGDNDEHSNDGACLPHNHGNSWRPAAVVGCIGKKVN